jgi:hypothetical protein
MIHDISVLGFQDKAQRGYIRIVSAFAEFLRELPCASLRRWLISMPAVGMFTAKPTRAI